MIRSFKTIVVLLLLPASAGLASSGPALSLKSDVGEWHLEWNGRPDQRRPYFEIQGSSDLKAWHPLMERTRAPEGSDTMAAPFNSRSDQPGFYRVMEVTTPTSAALSADGATILGYGAAFEVALRKIGQITPQEFGRMFARDENYVAQLSWDPTSAEFWNHFNANPEEENKGKDPTDPGYRTSDFRLSPTGLAKFRMNGFVVTDRGEGMAGRRGESFGNLFYDLWHNDLPVFISTDAILHAWHRTYDAILEEVEETFLFNSAQTLLDTMASQIPAVAEEIGDGALKESLRDADYFLTVARTLLSGTNQPPPGSILGTDALVARTLKSIHEETFSRELDFCGFCRDVDYSQFKVRGHYTHSERLGRYFQTLIWLGRIDFPVAGGPFDRCPYGEPRMAAPRELGTALVLWRLLHSSGHFDVWEQMDRTISVFVGVSDSMTFGQMNGLMAGAGITNLSTLRTTADLETIQCLIQSGQLGLQNIRSDNFGWPLGEGVPYALPQTFAVFGQKFVPDSWAFSQTVMDSIRWVDQGKTNLVARRLPGALDIAFSVLGNDQVVPELIAQMAGSYADPDRPHALAFRDGYNYQHNLAAVRMVMDQQTTSTWQSNIYMQWLHALRALSAPTTDGGFPESMRTHAWAMKTLNTQLASWTQLRHDTILYAKQSYTPGGQCIYPKGFVEPRLAFWQELEKLASLAGEQLSSLAYSGEYSLVEPWTDPETGQILSDLIVTNQIPLVQIQKRQVTHLNNFARIVSRLSKLTEKELAHQCFQLDDLNFIDSLVHLASRQVSCAFNTYSGWYASLFYRTIYWTADDLFHGTYGASGQDLLIADVHTDLPDILNKDRGSVLHEAVGHPNLLYMAIDNGSDRFICAGPVMSHYEFEVMDEPRRLSDPEWKALAPGGEGEVPRDVPLGRVQGLNPPAWTKSYLSPKE